jgi:hypothetical protein
MSSKIKRNLNTPRLLREIIDEIRAKDWTQAKIAERLGTEQPTISKMRTTDPDADWVKHWPILWRLQELCDDLGIKTEDKKVAVDDD